jgi:hypothetical protein
MLRRQIVYFLSKIQAVSKFPAFDLLRRSEHDRDGSRERRAVFRRFLTAWTPHSAIDLESAPFVFHMSITTQGITGSLRAACSEPVQRFLACPFS